MVVVLLFISLLASAMGAHAHSIATRHIRDVMTTTDEDRRKRRNRTECDTQTEGAATGRFYVCRLGHKERDQEANKS